MKWYSRLIRYPEIWLLSGAALVTRLWQLGTPQAIVFDEVYFREFAANYLSGSYFFDIHPPLIKLLFAGFGSVLGLTPEQIGGDDPAGQVLRYLPALAGAALVPLFYVILRQLRLGRRVATLGALFVLFDGALLVESRFVLMDSLLLLVGMGALSAYLALRQSKGLRRWIWVTLLAVLIGCLVSIKWTGLAIAGVLAFAWLAEGIVKRVDWRRMIGEAAIVITIVPAIYIGCFMVHFNLLTQSGEGDAFMSEKFQSTLVGNPYYSESARIAFWDKFTELNSVMYTAQSSLKDVEHPYSSQWYTWPLQLRPVYYWQGDTLPNGIQSNIYLLGNPLIWLASAVSVIVGLLIWIIRPKILGSRRNVVAFLLVGYGANFIPFAFIDRPMFLYHYFFAFLFALIITAVLLSLLFDWQARKYGRQVVKQTFWGIVAAVTLTFLFYLPVMYGWPLSPDGLQLRLWLPGWR
jgi:dolichyl-phosphate-mannose-protein mannosyltransferase